MTTHPPHGHGHSKDHPPEHTGSRIGRHFTKKRKQAVNFWVNFAEKYRDSKWLPIGLFILLTVHGFFPVIPVFLCITAVVAIDRKRWLLYGFLASIAETLNNSLTYLLGRLLSGPSFYHFVQSIHWTKLWNAAEHTIARHGTYAGFLGALLGLPNPLITAIIGLADAETIRHGEIPRHSFVEIMGLTLVGYLIRNLAIAGATRFGWKLFTRKVKVDVPPESKR